MSQIYVLDLILVGCICLGIYPSLLNGAVDWNTDFQRSIQCPHDFTGICCSPYLSSLIFSTWVFFLFSSLYWSGPCQSFPDFKETTLYSLCCSLNLIIVISFSLPLWGLICLILLIIRYVRRLFIRDFASHLNVSTHSYKHSSKITFHVLQRLC